MIFLLVDELRRYEKYLKKNYNNKYDLPTTYEFKSFCISNYVPQVINTLKSDEHKMALHNFCDYSSLRDYLASSFGVCSMLEGYRLNDSFKHRKGRLKSKIYTIISSGSSFFLTLTFTDDVLNSTSEFTRRRYVTRYLKKISSDYVANIDYGELNDREHYHCVVASEKVLRSDWKYGIMKWEKIILCNNSDEVLSKYVLKLHSHAIKTSTKRNYCLYARKKS